MSMIEYPKIYGPFKRCTEQGPDRNKLITGQWSCEEFSALADHPWIWTEKIDGTNIRIHWDGHKVTYGGRTANAHLPAKLLPILNQMFPEEVMESVFGSGVFTLFGEGYGAGIQSGGVYRKDQSFILFDVFSYGEDHKLFLKRDATQDIAGKLGIDHVPFMQSWWTPNEAIHAVREGYVASRWDVAPLEGLVGKPVGDFLSRRGERIAMKVKVKDKYTD